jgi:hypothetical protein
MHTSSYLVDDLILIDKLSASNEVLFNLCLMGPVKKLAVLKVKAYRPTGWRKVVCDVAPK